MLLTALAATGLAAVDVPAATDERVERRLAVMGTELTIVVDAADRATALRASEAALRALEATEDRLSTWRVGSELSRVNRSPAGEPVAISAELALDLAPIGALHRQTDGGFDPTVGTLTLAWGLRDGGRQPRPEEIEAAASRVGWDRLVRLDGTRLLRAPGVRLDEGGFGKGVGLDRALVAATQSGATAIVIDLGGQVALHGRQETVAVASPVRRHQARLAIRIEHGSLATSGNSERGLVIGGVRRGHLLDPRTGRPAPDWGSLTVWAPSATAADALSTGLYVLGPDRAIETAAAIPGVEALLQETTPQGVRARATPGLEERLVLDRGFEVTFVQPGAEGSRNRGDGERRAPGVIHSPSPEPEASVVAAADTPQ